MYIIQYGRAVQGGKRNEELFGCNKHIAHYKTTTRTHTFRAQHADGIVLYCVQGAQGRKFVSFARHFFENISFHFIRFKNEKKFLLKSYFSVDIVHGIRYLFINFFPSSWLLCAVREKFQVSKL